MPRGAEVIPLDLASLDLASLDLASLDSVREFAGAVRVVALFRPEFTMGTPERAGEALAEVALGAITLPPGRMYVSLVKGQPTFPDPSADLGYLRTVGDHLGQRRPQWRISE